VKTIKYILDNITKSLFDAEIPNPRMEARILLAHYMNYSTEQLITNQDEMVEFSQTILGLVNQRIEHKPLSYLLGYKEFYGRNFIVNENVLVPRPDTEILISAVLNKYYNNLDLNILELGVGSGCIIISLLLELARSKGLGVDISKEALRIASHNSDLYNCKERLTLLESDWYQNITPANQYDLIISNPPYIKKSEIALMSKETLMYEPEIALYTENYDSYKKIAKHAKNYLNNEGEIYLEIGINQGTEIKKIFIDNGYILKNQFFDFNTILRVLVFSKVLLA
jgi:release factor glutamine methyltransferase